MTLFCIRSYCSVTSTGVDSAVPATIDDLSCNGCRIGNHVRTLAVGSRVTIKFEGMEPLSGLVKWSNPDFAGLQFEASLHPSVLDRLFRVHGHA